MVSVTPAARASVSWSHVSCRELSSSTMAPPEPPPLLFQGKKGCVLTDQRRRDWSCVCELGEDSNTTHHSWGNVLNCSTKGALKSTILGKILSRQPNSLVLVELGTT